MVIGEPLTRIHEDCLQPSSTSAHATTSRARLEGTNGAQEIGSTTSFKNVFPIITSSPDLISAGLPRQGPGGRFTAGPSSLPVSPGLGFRAPLLIHATVP